MYKIKRVHIGGFRRLFDIHLEMRPLMVMIGANSVGKSSILDAFSLISASAAGTLNARTNDLGGVAALLTKGRAQDIVFDIEMEVPDPYEPLKYSFILTPKGSSYTISSESLTQIRDASKGDIPFKYIESFHDDIRYYEIDEGKLLKPTWDHHPLESSLSQVPKMFREPEELRRILSSVTQYRVIDVGRRAPVKLPQQMKPAEQPGAEGEDLVPFLYYLREDDPDRYETIIDTLKSAFTGFQSLSFPPVAAGMLSMTWKEEKFPKPFYMNELSEGTLRFLWLISLLQSSSHSTITMIDEPEVSLHPELLSLLADLMREAAQKTHLIVATHSDRLIRFLKPEEVVVMDIAEDGCATAEWADSLDLERWLEEYNLDEVWRMGRIDGRS
jgi:predicted ATPase